MSGSDPKGWGQSFLSFCVAVLGGTIALSLAVSLLESIWYWILAAVGLAALVWLGVVVYRTTRNHW